MSIEEFDKSIAEAKEKIAELKKQKRALLTQGKTHTHPETSKPLIKVKGDIVRLYSGRLTKEQFKQVSDWVLG